nr:MAG TPA: hypothetical protein [Caudoviricetes sp.]
MWKDSNRLCGCDKLRDTSPQNAGFFMPELCRAK